MLIKKMDDYSPPTKGSKKKKSRTDVKKEDLELEEVSQNYLNHFEDELYETQHTDINEGDQNENLQERSKRSRIMISYNGQGGCFLSEQPESQKAILGCQERSQDRRKR